MQFIDGAWEALRLALALSIAAAGCSMPAQAWTHKTLYSFTGGGDGSTPIDGLLRDEATGNLYGTTFYGSTNEGDCFGDGCGLIFRLTPDGTETVLHAFTGGDDGANPHAGLIVDELGNFYGTTEYGGDLDCPADRGCGVVFKLSQDGSYSVLHTFGVNGHDGLFPRAHLTRDTDTGDLYGTTDEGNGNSYGTIFRLAAGGDYRVLYSFDGSEGIGPQSAVTLDHRGNIYGTTCGNGMGIAGDGTVFKLTRRGKETVLHYCTQPWEYAPVGGLARDKLGNLYGTTAGNHRRKGGVFEISPDGAFHKLYRFKVIDGSDPEGDLLLTKSGTILGNTRRGGANNGGVVFQLDPDGSEQVLYSFESGAAPSGSLIQDKNGNIYGTTTAGGTYGKGTVYELLR